MSILIVRSRSASMYSLFSRRRYSASLVWPMMTSSMSVWANFLGLILCSCEAVFLREQQSPDAHLADDIRPIAVSLMEQAIEDVAAGRAQIAFDLDPLAVGVARVDLARDRRAEFGWDQVERVFVHGAVHALR